MTDLPVQKTRLSKMRKLVRLLGSVVDPRAWLHVFKVVNYYNYTHVAPLRAVRMGPGAAISPNVSFSHPERIEAGARLRLGAYCKLWAGPGRGRIVLGNDVLFGPEVMVTAANYRFNEGHPVNDQPMSEGDVIIGNDVWLGTRVLVLPGVTIGDGAIVGAGAVVTSDIPAMSIAVGVPARVVGRREFAAG
ncbi:acyltransferase [Falsirhodobacter sp. 20TX0035]|uniref:acyltransferase n=1 Tax=Falsirhodobacter sp. 20TX0035 TaxID=3022019 RepID=UPI00232D9DF3|nr:acyltransferase [Falsirhodobacter sp. 20TX0035]MDB6454597.1 acyltransferase [Falsirhodobacter sp. 20TX0035]